MLKRFIYIPSGKPSWDQILSPDGELHVRDEPIRIISSSVKVQGLSFIACAVVEASSNIGSGSIFASARKIIV
jgi:hypothetical protein